MDGTFALTAVERAALDWQDKYISEETNGLGTQWNFRAILKGRKQAKDQTC